MTESSAESSPGGDFDSPAYRAAVVDLLGALAYGELSAFGRMSADADTAPSLLARAELYRVAVMEYGHFERLRDRLVELGEDPEKVMQPFVPALTAFHERTAPSTWLESLVKIYVGDAIAGDFYREISVYLDPATRDLVVGVLADTGKEDLVLDQVMDAVAKDPKVTGRLSLWGRRLMGEALSQAQQVAADRDALASLVVGAVGTPGGGLSDLVQMFGRITSLHTQRMDRLGLSA